MLTTGKYLVLIMCLFMRFHRAGFDLRPCVLACAFLFTLFAFISIDVFIVLFVCFFVKWQIIFFTLSIYCFIIWQNVFISKTSVLKTSILFDSVYDKVQYYIEIHVSWLLAYELINHSQWL